MFSCAQTPQRTYHIEDWGSRLEARGQNLVYVVDGGPPTQLQKVKCPIIVFTSTGKGGIKDLRKNMQRHKLWMYAWTLPELEACRNKIPAYQRVELPLLTGLWGVCVGAVLPDWVSKL